MRKCLVADRDNKRIAFFHCWSQEAWTVGASPMVGGSPAGQVSLTLGIVEYSDGTVAKVYPERIRFDPDSAEAALGEGDA